jgi:hypothetical protein
MTWLWIALGCLLALEFAYCIWYCSDLTEPWNGCY